jgi:hypothetical protein
MTIARIEKVVTGHQPYAVAVAQGISGTVTFSLRRDVWLEESSPMAENRVVLDDLRKNDHGWRAYKARFMRPEDEEPKK